MSDELIQPVQTGAAAPEDEARDFFRAERDLAREQISAAWQIQVEHIHDLIDRGWRDHVARAFDERFEALRLAAESEIERRVSARLAQETERARASAARELSEKLNQSARRLEQSEDLNAWSASLLDGVSAFGQRVWLFSVLDGKLNLEGARSAAAPGLTVELAAAPAFQTVIESLDTVISMGAAGELGDQIAALVDGAECASQERRICLLPVIAGQSERERRVAAVVMVDGAAAPLNAPLDVNAIEVVTALAGAALDARQAAQRAAANAAPGALVALAPAAAVKTSGAPPDWQSLTREDQEIHARAQRFARVRVAEMRLYQAEAVRNGREQARLYMALRGEMDRSRAQFKHEYMHTPTMVDYFHLEVLHTLANDDASLLGPEYPGPLV